VNNLLIAMAVFVITVVGALFAVPYFIDWNSYRAIFEEEARNVIGRDVEVDGDVALHLLPTPYFRVEKVRIADTSTTLSEHFFKTDSLSIKLSIAPLLRGVVEVNEIEFQRPVLRAALDAKGGWNWQSFAQALRSTGYMPANVTLSSLKVVDGVLAFHGADGMERTRLDRVNGELSAPALDGPYRFRGSFTSNGGAREIRISTSPPEADGKVPVRASLRLLDTGATYVLDARTVDLLGKARIEGDLTARLPVATPPPAGGLSKRMSAEEELDIDRRETPLEAKAAIKADIAGAVFSDLTMTFEMGDRPQIVTGTARAAWRTPVAIDMDLASRWLDFDQMAGAAEGAGPGTSVAKLAAWVLDLLPAESLTKVSLAVDQTNLAGEVMGPVRLKLAQSPGRLEIAELRTALPGGTSLDLKGDITRGAGAPAFKGSVGLRGQSAGRFVAWATGNGLAIPADADGPFDLRTGIAVEPGQVAVRDLTGRLAASSLKGGGHYRWAGRPELTVALEGNRLDARSLLPAELSLPDLIAVLGRAPAGKDDGRAPAGTGVARLLNTDIDVQLKAGELVTAQRTYRDFSTTLATKDGSLKQLRIRLSGDDGYNLDLEGKVENLAGVPKGTVRGHVTAETPNSIAPLAALLGIPAGLHPGESRERALLPLRLAGTMAFGARTATSTDVTVDGEGNGATVKVNARFDGGAGGWRSGKAEITAAVDASDSTKVAALLFPGATLPGRPGGVKPGRILVRAAGVPAEGIAGIATVEAADAALSFRGQVKLADAGFKADGDLEAKAANGTALAAFAGLPPDLRADGVPVSARGRLALDGSTVAVDKLALQLGGARLYGKISLSDAQSAPHRRRIDASLGTDEISVAALLGPLLDQRFGAAAAAEAVLGRGNPWPDVPFSAAVLDAFEGQIDLSCKRLVLAEGLGLEGAKLKVVLQPGRVEAKEIAGAALGGDIRAALSIQKAAGGADVRGSLGFDAALDQFPGPRPPRAAGRMKGRMEFAGRGVSPRAAVAALHGTGSVELTDAKLPGLSPAVLPAAADVALKAEPDKIGPTLRQTIAKGLGAASLSTGKAAAPLEIVDGTVRGGPLVVETGEGRASGLTRLDLKDLKLESKWQLEAKVPAGGAAKALPAVTVSYQAPVAALGSTEAQVDTAVLEQELLARKAEHDLEELERLRREGDAARKGLDPAAPALRPPDKPTPIIPPFGHEVRPSGPG
jgi:uncharacterized protein involved in outer membrane biogenesis